MSFVETVLPPRRVVLASHFCRLTRPTKRSVRQSTAEKTALLKVRFFSFEIERRRHRIGT